MPIECVYIARIYGNLSTTFHSNLFSFIRLISNISVKNNFKNIITLIEFSIKHRHEHLGSELISIYIACDVRVFINNTNTVVRLAHELALSGSNLDSRIIKLLVHLRGAVQNEEKRNENINKRLTKKKIYIRKKGGKKEVKRKNTKVKRRHSNPTLTSMIKSSSISRSSAVSESRIVSPSNSSTSCSGVFSPYIADMLRRTYFQ